jgi:hypothetical protein
MASSFGYSLNFIRYFLAPLQRDVNPFSANFRPKTGRKGKIGIHSFEIKYLSLLFGYYQPTIFYLCKMVGIRKKYKVYGHFLQINDSRSTIGPNLNS